MNELTTKFKEALVTYTEKHPGHTNQRVHNPKGGVGGAMRKAAINSARKYRPGDHFSKLSGLEKFARTGAVFGGGLVGREIGGKVGAAFGPKDEINFGKLAGHLVGSHIGSSAGLRLSEGIRKSRNLSKNQKRVANALVGVAGTGYTAYRYGKAAYQIGKALAPFVKAAYYGSKRGFAKARTQENYARSKRPKRPDYDPSTGGPIIQGTYIKGGQLVPYRGKELAMSIKEFEDVLYTEKHPGHPNQNVHGKGGGYGLAGKVAGKLGGNLKRNLKNSPGGLAVRAHVRGVKGVVSGAKKVAGFVKKHPKATALGLAAAGGVALSLAAGRAGRNMYRNSAARGMPKFYADKVRNGRVDSRGTIHMNKELQMITLKEYLDWRYTEKHPGHANQSVHAPKGGGGMGSRVGGAIRAGASAYGRAAGKVAGGYAKVGRAAGKLAVAGVKRYAVNRSGLGTARRALAVAKAGVRIGKKVAPVAGKIAKAGIKRYVVNRSGLGTARQAVKVARGVGKVAGAVGRGYGRAAKKVWGGIGSVVGKEVGSVTLKSYGDNRWTLIASGSFQDRDGEWLTEKGLRQWADSFGTHTKEINGRTVPVRPNGEPVVLRWWHVGFPVPETRSKGVGVDLGICDFACYNSKSLIMSGTYNDPEVGAAFSAKGKELKGSIGFFHPKTEPVEGQFLNPDVYEVSYLPHDRASYPFSALIV